MSNVKGRIIQLIPGLIKRCYKINSIKMSQYFPPYKSFGRNINVKLDLSNYATKTDSKEATGIDTSNFALKSNLTSLKTEVDTIDTDKLQAVPVDLSKLSNVVKIEVVNKTVYHKLATKVNSIDTTGLILKTKYTVDKLDLEKKFSDVEKKIPDTSDLLKTDFSKILLFYNS